LDTQHNTTYTLSSYGYTNGLTVSYRVVDGPLQPGTYRFTAEAGLTDRAGNPLTVFQSNFTLADLSPYVLESRSNDTSATATPPGAAGAAFAGSFTARPAFAAGGGAHSVAVGDFNQDGNPDFATANNGTNTVSVFLGDGALGFSRADFTVGNNPV